MAFPPALSRAIRTRVEHVPDGLIDSKLALAQYHRGGPRSMAQFAYDYWGQLNG